MLTISMLIILFVWSLCSFDAPLPDLEWPAIQFVIRELKRRKELSSSFVKWLTRREWEAIEDEIFFNFKQCRQQGGAS